MTDAELVVLVPSRSRPELLLKCWESVRDSYRAALLAYVDVDQYDRYSKLPATFYELARVGTNNFVRGIASDGDPRFVVIIGPRVGPLAGINTACHACMHPIGLTEHFPKARAFAYLTDDSTIGPAGWDQRVLAAIDSFPQGIGVVALYHGADYVNFYAISKEMVAAVGGYAIPEVNHAWYWDTAMELIGDATQIVYTQPAEVTISHTYEKTVDSIGIPDADARNFAFWCITGRKRVIVRVRAALAEAMKQ